MRLRRFEKEKGIKLMIDLKTLEIYHAKANKNVKLCFDKRSYVGEDGFWHVYPIGYKWNQIFIVCPYCGEIHVHGYGEGHRGEHCVEHEVDGMPKIGYFIDYGDGEERNELEEIKPRVERYNRYIKEILKKERGESE